MSFGTCGKRRSHTPHYLAVARYGAWLVDVRPEPLIKEADRESFAAAAEAAVACGWRYAVAARWREQPSRAWTRWRRGVGRGPIRWGFGRCCSPWRRAGGGPGELVAATGWEPVARAQLLHLLWSRQLGVDLAGPLEDRSFVMSAGETGRWPRRRCWAPPSAPGWCWTGRNGRSSAANDTWVRSSR
ncbi:hypothetical protein ACI2L4_33685 [Streptomyces sparsogenes]|uniref:hypothetical protein n=1 Tax=Streptomyces sparsogenes TaxID=67365 RepID=UPI0034074E93